MSFTIACLDMAGTTVADDGVVMDAFESAISGRGLSGDGYEQAMKDVRATMGQSKIEVFRRILGDEDAYDHLRARASQLLGAPLPPTQRRWAGVYSQVTTGELYHRSTMEPGVVLVTGPGGRGMTCSPAIAEETFA